jgi:methylglutaconyl-CoA hydratase
VSAVRVDAARGVGRVTLARPEQGNALDRQAVVDVSNALKRLDADGSVRVVLLDAEGRDFCAGADLAALAAPAAASRTAHADDAQALARLVTTLRAMMKPGVAAVHGRAFDAGAALASACDVVLASASARFGYPEVQVGFVPAVSIPLLRRAVGEKRAAELVLTGRTITADEAERIGLVSRVLPDGDFRDAALEVARGIAQAPELAVALTKRLLYHVDGLDFREGIAAGVKTSVEARLTRAAQAVPRRPAEGEGGA